MIPLIIHSDSVVGTTAFWYTRPISRQGLLITKATLIFLFIIIIRLVTELIVLASQGANLRQILLATPEILIENLAFVIPFLILAAITPKFSRYALVGVIVFASIIVVSILWTVSYIIISKYYPDISNSIFNGDKYKNASLVASIDLIQNILVIIAGSSIIAYQFLTRKTVRTVLFTIIGFLITIGAGPFWRIDFLKQPEPVKTTANKTEPNLSVAFDSNYISVFDEPTFSKKDERRKTISTKMVVTGLSPDEFAMLDNMKVAEMKYPDGNSVTSSYLSNKDFVKFTDEKFMEPIQAVLKDVKLLNPNEKEFTYTEIFGIDELQFHKYKNVKGDYNATDIFDVFRYKIVSSVPLKQGAKDSFDSEQMVIYAIIKKGKIVSVVVNERKIVLLFDRTVKKKSMVDYAQDMYSEYEDVYLLVNKKRGEAFLPEKDKNIFAAPMEMYSQSRLKTFSMKLDYTNLNGKTPLPEINDQWLADAELVRLGIEKVRSETVKFTIKGFALPEKSTVEKTDKSKIEKRMENQYE
jgi:hypothetical protein